MTDLAAEREYLRALRLFRTHRGEPFRPLEDDLRDVGERLDVVDDGRLAEQTLHGGERRTRTRLASVALDRGQQRRFLAANKRACAQTKLDVEVEAGGKYVLTQQAVFARLLDGDLKALDGNRVFRTDIYVALVCADGVAGDGHRLQHGVRVALEHRAVHKRAGVALVRVAYDVFLIRNALGGKVPLRAGGEARAAAAAQTAVGDELDDLRRRHLGQTFAERLIAVHRDVFVDDLGVDDTAVAQRHALLLLVEVCVGKRHRLAFRQRDVGLVVHQTGDGTALEQMLLNDLGDDLRRHARIKGALGIHDHDRPQLAETEAAGLDDLDFVVQPADLQLFLQRGQQRRASGGGAAGTAAYQYMRSNHNKIPSN